MKKIAKIEIYPTVVDCPKCDEKMVPLSGSVYEKSFEYAAVPYKEWKCVKCGFKVEASK